MMMTSKFNWVVLLLCCATAQSAEQTSSSIQLATTARKLTVVITAPSKAPFDSSAAWAIDGEIITITVTAKDNQNKPPTKSLNLYVKNNDDTDETGWSLKGSMTQTPTGATTYTYNWNTAGTSIGRHRIRVKASQGYDGKAEMIIHRGETKPTVITGYCNCFKCTRKNPGPGYGITAHGTTATSGTLAAPSTYLFHTEIYVPLYNGDQLSTVYDRGEN